MAEVARRCRECGADVRDLTEEWNDERDHRPTAGERARQIAATTAIVALSVIGVALTAIGGATTLIVAAVAWPSLPWS